MFMSNCNLAHIVLLSMFTLEIYIIASLEFTHLYILEFARKEIASINSILLVWISPHVKYNPLLFFLFRSFQEAGPGKSC